uniref:Glycosyltransferase n=1 Tax=Desulfatirhabdium butyrativorans TaxID=340467 RepID=A0A7C4RQW0_9BACT
MVQTIALAPFDNEVPMWMPIRVMEIELSAPQSSLNQTFDGYGQALALVRLHGVPVGIEKFSLIEGKLDPLDLKKAILKHHAHRIIRTLISKRLTSSLHHLLTPEDILTSLRSPPDPVDASLAVTVAVCTRDRATDLAMCLEALSRLRYPNLEILVVDNAASTDATRKLVHDRYPQVRYVLEPRPGLDWARNRAIQEAKGDIVAFTDDDVIVDPGWIDEIVRVFQEDATVMGVTGMVVPWELETEAQWLFERYGGFNRGFDPKWALLGTSHAHLAASRYIGTGQFGTGANMAFRKQVFESIGYFDPALDVGTVTSGGGDLEMFFRLLREGYGLMYEPKALVWHRHRRTRSELQSQIESWGTGFYAYLTRSAQAYPDNRFAILRFGFWWLWRHLRRYAAASIKPSPIPNELVMRELRGSLKGPFLYMKARKRSEDIRKRFGPLKSDAIERRTFPASRMHPDKDSVAVRTIDLQKGIPTIEELGSCHQIRLIVTWSGKPIGALNVNDVGPVLSAHRLRYEIADAFGLDLFSETDKLDKGVLWSKIIDGFIERCMPKADGSSSGYHARKLPPTCSVSVVIATRDRPDDLRECLRFLSRQRVSRPIDIVVVDNNPASGLTEPVVSAFPNVRLAVETRRGSSYARNCGIRLSTGDIVAVTDDDTTMPEDWLETLIAPFEQPDVGIVTGNVLPFELETQAQRLFEQYGGLGRGYIRWKADRDWFDEFTRKAVPTWYLGGTANVAFRRSIFSDPNVGLFEETLGSGVPTGVGEDTYMFYRALKEGYTVVYEPSAYVWHKHRKTMSDLQRQIYAYSRGHVAYHLTTLFRDGDFRALTALFYTLPRYHAARIRDYILGWTNYPLRLAFLEFAGHLAGPWAYWKAHRMVKRMGRSDGIRDSSQQTEDRSRNTGGNR